MFNDPRSQTLIGNIGANLVRAGQHRPVVSPRAALLRDQQATLANSLTEAKANSLSQQTAADKQAAELAAQYRPVIDKILFSDALTQEKISALAMLPGGVGKPAIDRLSVAQEGQIKGANLDLGKRKQDFAEEKFEYEKTNPGGADPYFTGLPTPEGYVSFDNRTGTAEPLKVNGERAVRSQDSPGLQGAIAQSKEIGQKKGIEDQALYEQVSSAPPKLKKLDEVLELLESSDTITGLGAEMLKQIERAKVMVGGNADKLNRTQLLDVMLGADVFPMIKDLGIGARGMDTPAERDYMRQVLTGQITLEKDTLVKMTKLRKRLIQAAIDKWDERVENGELDRWSKATGIKAKKYGNKEDVAPATWGEVAPMGEDIEQPQPLPTTISSDAEYDILPSGAEFIAPDKTHRRKP